MINILKNTFVVFEDIKIHHTIFAMPFAVMSMFLASKGIPDLLKFFWIVIAMIGARSAAMIFNRIVDAKYDKNNPRTENRALASSRINKSIYFLYLLAFVLLFVYACFSLNSLCLYLSPVALLIVFFYSFTKRFTSFSHFFLGAALSLAPLGAWIAVAKNLSTIPFLIALSVIFWLAGLDTIYSCQDYEFDKDNKLWSIPGKYGIDKALKLSAKFHMLMIVFLLILPLFEKSLGMIYFAGVLITAGLLTYEHSLVKPDDLSRVNVAFFNVNGIISVLLMSFVIVDCLY